MLAALCGAAPASAQKTQTQRFFEQRLLAGPPDEHGDQDAAAQRRRASSTKAVVFRDLTGDKRDDAVVRVHSGGAAGVVAVYVFSTANRKNGKLRAIFRSQSLMRASTRVLKGVVSYRTSRYEPGDELCCPARITQSTLGWVRRRAPLPRARARDVRAAARGPGARGAGRERRLSVARGGRARDVLGRARRPDGARAVKGATQSHLPAEPEIGVVFWGYERRRAARGGAVGGSSSYPRTSTPSSRGRRRAYVLAAVTEIARLGSARAA